MKAFRILGRNIRDAFRSVIRNFSLSAASISCITITLIVVSISIILSYNVDHFASLIEKDVTIVVFLDRDVNEEAITIIDDKIKNLDNVETYSFKTREEVSSEMQSEYDVFEGIMSEWTEETNPLQDSFLVKVIDIERIGETASQIKEMEGVDVVKYGEGMVEKLVSVLKVIEKVSFGIVLALVIVTAFLIGNTIKLTIFSRKREIEIMRLVGASNLNIKIPFIFEGLFLGILGSIIPILITVYGYIALYNNFNGTLFSPFITLVEPEPFVYVISLVLVTLGIIVGMLGSARAVRKYLKI